MAGGQCRLGDGTIAGSVLKLNEGLRNFQANVEESLEEVLPLVTLNQAKYLKVEKEMGSLDMEKLANITVMDRDLNIRTTIVKGEVQYEVES